jgi:hypothetical protein
VSANIRIRAALCLALSLADTAKARADDPCAQHAAVVATWRAAKSEVRAAERDIDALEADPVLASVSICSAGALASHRCRDSHFSREAELERARGRLAAAEERVASVEESARIAEVPMVCLVETNE